MMRISKKRQGEQMTVQVSGIANTVMHYGRNRKMINAPGATVILFSFRETGETVPGYRFVTTEGSSIMAFRRNAFP